MWKKVERLAMKRHRNPSDDDQTSSFSTAPPVSHPLMSTTNQKSVLTVEGKILARGIEERRVFRTTNKRFFWGSSLK
jgi:hypothetical protein